MAANNAVALETSQGRESERDLKTLFETLSASSPARKVTYKFMGPNFFVVTGEMSGRTFYTRIARGEVGGVGGVRDRPDPLLLEDPAHHLEVAADHDRRPRGERLPELVRGGEPLVQRVGGHRDDRRVRRGGPGGHLVGVDGGERHVAAREPGIPVALAIVGVWAATFLLSRYTSVASIVSAVAPACGRMVKVLVALPQGGFRIASGNVSPVLT